jgi:hypothetical protein
MADHVRTLVDCGGHGRLVKLRIRGTFDTVPTLAITATAVFLLAACGPAVGIASPTVVAGTPIATAAPVATPAFPSFTWSATGPLPGDASGNVAVDQVAAGAYVVQMTGCRRSATLTGGAASGNPFGGIQVTLYDGQDVLVPGDGAYTVSALDAPNLACDWTLTLVPK